MAIFTIFWLFNKRKGERHLSRFCNLSWSASLSHQVCFWLIFHQCTPKKQKTFQHLLLKTSFSFMVCVWRILQYTRFYSFIMCKQSVLVHKINASELPKIICTSHIIGLTENRSRMYILLINIYSRGIMGGGADFKIINKFLGKIRIFIKH